MKFIKKDTWLDGKYDEYIYEFDLENKYNELFKARKWLEINNISGFVQFLADGTMAIRIDNTKRSQNSL